MKVKYLLLILPFLLLGVLVVKPVSAGPPSANIARAVELITRPCSSAGISTSNNYPALVSCESAANGSNAFIRVPVPHLVDQAPNLSLVSIPTFHRLTWDLESLAFIDTAKITYAYPAGGPTDRLVNLRVELRLMPGKASPENDDIAIENVVLNAIGPTIYHMDDGTIPEYVCAKYRNTLLAIPSGQGGLIKGKDDNECQGIKGLLAATPINIPSLGEVERYEDWKPLLPQDAMTFSPYASINGKGTYDGSPAFQIAATTSFNMEARVIWDVHQVKQTVEETVCDWSFWEDYDFIDWDNWPDPVFCRREVRVDWVYFCKPSAGDCPYGKPGGWWQPILEGSVDLLRRPDKTYAKTYDFLSVQSQPLLTSP
jgi:hypothetical protein